MRNIRFILPLLLILGACVAATADPIREVIPDKGVIDWSNQVIQATGSGARPANAESPGQARLLAKRAAIADAYRNLAQVISEVHVTSDTTVEKFITTNDTVRLKVEAFVRGARVVNEQFDADGTVTVTLQIGMAGKAALTGTILPEILPAPSHLPPTPDEAAPATPAPGVNAEPPLAKPAQTQPGLPALLEPDLLTPESDEGPFTGVIIDARGLDVQPAMCPRILDAEGRELYGTMKVDPEYVEEVGVAGYMGTIRAAMGIARVGKHPLVVRAAATPDTFRRYVTLSARDAERVRRANRHDNFFGHCAVIFVVDERRARDEER